MSQRLYSTWHINCATRKVSDILRKASGVYGARVFSFRPAEGRISSLCVTSVSFDTLAVWRLHYTMGSMCRRMSGPCVPSWALLETGLYLYIRDARKCGLKSQTIVIGHTRTGNERFQSQKIRPFRRGGQSQRCWISLILYSHYSRMETNMSLFKRLSDPFFRSHQQPVIRKQSHPLQSNKQDLMRGLSMADLCPESGRF